MSFECLVFSCYSAHGGFFEKRREKGEDEGGREQQNIEYRIMNNEVGKKEINVWEKLFTVIDIVCRIVLSNRR